jgi:hypothetical protein
VEYVNTDVQDRVWPTIQRPDGRTLELGPSETVELELGPDFEDSFLKPVAPAADLRSLKLADLKDHAASLGVEGVEGLRSKQAVLDAIDAHASAQEPDEEPGPETEAEDETPADDAGEDAGPAAGDEHDKE